MKYYLIHTVCAILAFVIVTFVDMTMLEKGSTADLAAKSLLIALIIFITYYYIQLNRHTKYHD
ncbi:hypothetical protein ACMGE9_06065 [Macrococcus sp. EM39E]|uniref:hypothetical protein n=1 Tax=Macrococcus animalis TaxID=3395467 RepID=UPI0039BEBB59